MDTNELPKWRTVASNYLVNDRWLKLRADTCITPEGHTIEPWYVLEYPEWVNCLVIDDTDHVILLRHYRHGIDEYVLEIVGGIVDLEDKNPETTLVKELREEIGYEGGEIYKTGVAYANPSNQNNKSHTFIAVGGRASDNTAKELGANFFVETMPFKDFVSAISDPSTNTVYQSLHIAAVFFALNFIERGAITTPALQRLRKLLK